MLPLLLACAPDTLAPDAAVTGDAMLAALPADVTLVASVDMAALPEALRAPARDALRRAGVPAVERGRLGCGGAGCVALLEGDFAGMALEREEAVQADGAVVARVAPARGTLPGLDAWTRAGEPLALRRLAPGKLVVGDRAAVRAAAAARRGGFHVEQLTGAIPEGAAWVAARDLDRLLDQADDRLARRGEVLPDALLDLLTAAPVELEAVDVVALSFGADGVARLRVTTRDEDTADIVQRALVLGSGRLAAPVQVARVGRQVEASGGAAALLDTLR